MVRRDGDAAGAWFRRAENEEVSRAERLRRPSETAGSLLAERLRGEVAFPAGAGVEEESLDASGAASMTAPGEI